MNSNENNHPSNRSTSAHNANSRQISSVSRIVSTNNDESVQPTRPVRATQNGPTRSALTNPSAQSWEYTQSRTVVVTAAAGPDGVTPFIRMALTEAEAIDLVGDIFDASVGNLRHLDGMTRADLSNDDLQTWDALTLALLRMGATLLAPYLQVLHIGDRYEAIADVCFSPQDAVPALLRDVETYLSRWAECIPDDDWGVPTMTEVNLDDPFASTSMWMSPEGDVLLDRIDIANSLPQPGILGFHIADLFEVGHDLFGTDFAGVRHTVTAADALGTMAESRFYPAPAR